MRLLFVHDRFGAMAGAEVNLGLTAAALKERGHRVGLLHGASTGRGESAWNDIFAETFPLAPEDTSAATRTALEQFQPDVVYLHNMSDADVLAALVQSGRRVVRMVHDHNLYCLRSYKYFPLTRKVCTRAAGPGCVFPCGGTLARSRNNGFPFQWRSYFAKQREIALNRRFHRFVVATEYMKQELLRNRFDSDRIEIHAPVPRTNGDAKQSSFSDRNLIVYAGQIIRGKGVDVLLSALTQVRFPFECVILGDGNHRAHCEKLGRQTGLNGRVHFKGYVPPDELAAYYAEASVAAVSSVWPEPFGAVGLEAMRHGLPVVAFDAGGIREWLRDGTNGFLVPWMDRAMFAARVEQLLRDKALARRLGERGRQLAGEQFNFENYISDLEAMFARVIGEAPAKLVS